MIDLRFVPMERPPAAGTHVAQFRASYMQTLDMLEDELKKLGARSVTIQAGFRLEDIRNDGWPKSKVKATHPACAIEFQDRSNQKLVFRAIKFKTFEDNLRAIALTLEALRAVDRYGVVEGQQYAGFKQLAAAPAKMTEVQAAHWLAAITHATVDSILKNQNLSGYTTREENLKALYRIAAQVVHPDRPTGSHADFTMLQEVMAILQDGGN